MGYTKLEKFLHKNQHTQRKILNFENLFNGEVSKVPTFKINFYVKNHWKLSQVFFSLNNINLGAHFLLLAFDDKINFYISLFSKLHITFLWVCWFLGKNIFNFVYPAWKLDNLYCHTSGWSQQIKLARSSLILNVLLWILQSEPI